MKTIRPTVIVAMVMISAAAAFAQENPERAALYAKFFNAYTHAKEIKKADPNLTQADTKQAFQRAATEAYEVGKEYLQKYAAVNDQYLQFITKFVDSYAKTQRRTQLLQQLTEKKYKDAFLSSKQVLADFPDDLEVLYQLVSAGFAAATSGNDDYNADAIADAMKLSQLVQGGKNPTLNKTKDEVLSSLNYALGVFTRKTQPAQALTYFIDAVQLGGGTRQDPRIYIYLAALYETGEYAGLATQYNEGCKTGVQLKTRECVSLTAKIYQVVDRIIDALSRAIAYSNTGPSAAKYDQARTDWMVTLTKYYKFRNEGSDAGLKELIESVTSKPLPTALQ